VAEQDWLALAEIHEAVARTLEILGSAELRWTDLYHLFEIVQADVGRQMYEHRWIAKTEADLFTWTANSPAVLGAQARHGAQRNDPRQTRCHSRRRIR
jgi:hypothetical protein